MNNKMYGGYSQKPGVARHDLSRRRTLKKKHVLLRSYGVYALSFATFSFGVHMIN